MHDHRPCDRDIGGCVTKPEFAAVRTTGTSSPNGDHHTQSPSYTDLRAELLRAELAAELSEFQALSFQAVLAVLEMADCAEDYLEMAETVAITAHELAILAGIRATRDRTHHCILPIHFANSDSVVSLWHSLASALAEMAIDRVEIRR